MDTLEGRVALVTGGSRGIGLAAARGLGAAGATVVLVGADPLRAEEAAAALVAEGLDAVGAPGVDVAETGSLKRLRGRLGPLGAVDIVVASAGVMTERSARTLRVTPEEWRRVMGINLDGVLGAAQAFVPGMVERRWGRFVALSACLGRMSGPGTNGGLAAYRISKAAVNALVKNLSAELGDGKRGVGVDAVCPGHARTDMGGPDAPRSVEQGADTVVWLCTREAGETGLLWEDRSVVPW